MMTMMMLGIKISQHFFKDIKMKILFILLLLTSCGSAPVSCYNIKSDYEKQQCKEADSRWYDESGWRYDRRGYKH